MLEPTIWRVAQSIADERAQLPEPYEGYVILRDRRFPFPQQLLQHFAVRLSNTRTKLQALFATLIT